MKCKKLLVLLLVCVMGLVLVACGEGDSTVDAPSESTEETKVDKGTEEKQNEEKEFEEKVFVDDENCTFKVSDIINDEIWGYTLKVDLENKTDKNLMFSLDNVSVNGYMCDPFWANSVQAGKKAKSDISFSNEEFEELGIEDVEEIEFTLLVYDEDDWETPRFVEETFVYSID